MEKLNYIIEDSTIAELLGVQNFSTDEAAILELVKNAYDAKALNLILKFSDDELEIIDDGDGMDSDDIKEHWMHIGKSDKDYEIVDENNQKRIQAGSKGVGRFALSRLGKQINLFTKKEESNGVIWKTDWNGSTLEDNPTNNEKGTHIVIKGLREKWNDKRVKNLNKYLEKTYNDTAMKIEIISDKYKENIQPHFPKAEAGKNCRSNIILKYDNGKLSVTVLSDEFSEEAIKYCPDIDINKYENQIDVFEELKGTEILQLIGDELKEKINNIGEFSASLFFNLTATNIDKEKFLYKYLETPQSVESGIILYRNAFSISSYEGEKDWLRLGKRSRKSPAAASHPTGSWRVRENQMSGSVIIDKKKNVVLQDMMNRQGLDENDYYELFIQIISLGLKEFERYRQSIIRKINVKNENKEEKKKTVSEKVIKNPTTVNKLTEDETKQLVDELKSFKQEGHQIKKEKADVEARYKYDVRILNVLATTGLKASSIAHELKNDRNTIYESYDNIVKALKEYDMWDELNLPENMNKSYKNVPYLLKSNDTVGKKIVSFMDTMLSEIEKRQFEAKWQSVSDIVCNIKDVWMRDYAWISIQIGMEEDVVFNISEDMIQVILDNLILNSVQQNENRQQMNIIINVCQHNGVLKFMYSDDGRGLDNKYLKHPTKILEVHETTRTNGHGLGMWIVNNTVVMSGGEIQNISGNDGFKIEFTIGDKN